MMTTIQEAIRTIGYSKIHTAQFDSKTYEFFKLESDGCIYVLCVNTNRATRYNGEGMNGKRIGMDAYLTAHDTLDHEAAIKDLDDAAEDPEISAEEFAKRIEETEESLTTEETKEFKDMYCRHPEGTDLQVPAVFNQYGCVDCSKCNVQNCVHRDCMRRNPTSEGGLAECPRLKVKAEEPKQPKAEKRTNKRVSKDIAWGKVIDSVDVSLTAKQVDFIRHLSDTNFWEQGLDSCIWVDILCDEIGGQFENKPMTVGAMVSTLCEKGLGVRGKDRVNGRKCTSFALTELGKHVAAELGLH